MVEVCNFDPCQPVFITHAFNHKKILLIRHMLFVFEGIYLNFCTWLRIHQSGFDQAISAPSYIFFQVFNFN
jgi:hypothetical protein